ncbi:tail assembly protein [Pseudoxanthomonas winnipegensis]|uniref:tail assembly protein n=1 Tax=Pseudoxanthomonas winnipegensis TaxID=2480810 RepID=UPI002577B3A5|nr:tail assembly protein [Pseudoxanthomonas winnipegensis]WJI14946.1 tail assembly protein [Pseudoxanthomonas winnipegensis]
MQVETPTTILLSGSLARQFGRRHSLVVGSAAEAVRALCAMLPGFKRYMVNAKDCGLEFAVFAGKRNLGLEQLHDPCSKQVIRLIPVLRGAKNSGWLQTVIGVAIIVVAGVASGGTAFSALGAGAAGTAAGYAASLGLAVALGGVSQIIAGTPKGLSTREESSNQPSYSFSGVVNTLAQGGCVPVGYGEMIVGSAVISAGIYAEDQQ